MRHARQPALGYQVFVCLRPGGDRSSGWNPVGVRGFVTPFDKTRHNFGVRCGAAKRFHSSLTCPHGQGPERARKNGPRIEMQSKSRLVSRRGGVILGDFIISSDWVADFAPLSTEGRKSYRLRHGFNFSFGEVLNHRIEGGLRFHRRGDLAGGWLLAEGGTIPSQYPNRITAPVNVTLIDQFGDSHCARAAALVERMLHPKRIPVRHPGNFPDRLSHKLPNNVRTRSTVKSLSRYQRQSSRSP